MNQKYVANNSVDGISGTPRSRLLVPVRTKKATPARKHPVPQPRKAQTAHVKDVHILKKTSASHHSKKPEQQKPAAPAIVTLKHEPSRIKHVVKQEEPKVHNQSPGVIRKLQVMWTDTNVQQRLLFGMATLLFVCGMAVTLYGVYINGQVAASPRQHSQDTSSSEPSEKPVTNAEKDNYTVPADHPKLITIPKINVKARVKSLGVKKDNELDAPKNVWDAGWFNQSAKPGNPGAVLIDGHNSGITSKGIFYDLKKLEKGDEIIIERGDGKKFSYEVVSKQAYSKDSVDMAKAVTPIDPSGSGLNLITCTGKFIASENQFAERLLVQAVQKGADVQDTTPATSPQTAPTTAPARESPSHIIR